MFSAPCDIHGATSPNSELYRTYHIWRLMLRRCYDVNCNVYYKYGAKGITVCDAWRSFRAFVKDMGIVPDNYTLDRIDGNKGYSPDNCRWATYSQQIENQKPRSNTGHKNVSFIGGLYCIEVVIDGEKHRGKFNTLQEAVQHRDYLKQKREALRSSSYALR